MTIHVNHAEILLLIEEKVVLKKHMMKHKKDKNTEKVTRIKKQIEELEAMIMDLSDS